MGYIVLQLLLYNDASGFNKPTNTDISLNKERSNIIGRKNLFVFPVLPFLERKLDGNYTRILRAIFNKSWQQHPSKIQLYGHQPPIMKSIQVRRTRPQDTAGEAETSSYVMYSYGPPHMADQKQDDQLDHTYGSYERVWDVALKTCRR